MIRLGAEAPGLEAEAYVSGEPASRRISLDDYRGRWVVLFFYPADFTFVCPTEIRAFAALEADFASEDAVVVGASTDTYWSHRAWFESDERLAGVRYPVIADPSHRLAEAFGVLDPDGAAMRATFIVDPAGAVRSIAVTERSVGRSVEETLRVLRALRTGELCPVEWKPGEPTLSARAS